MRYYIAKKIISTLPEIFFAKKVHKTIDIYLLSAIIILAVEKEEC